VQLIARELDRQDIETLGIHDGFQHRGADIADRERIETLSLQDRLQHLHGRRLAVGAGHREPRSGVLAAQPPGQLDLAPDRDVEAGRGQQDRRGRRPSRDVTTRS